MKKVYLFAVVAAFFAACSSDDLAVKEQPQAQTAPGAVGFDVYTQKATTRGGTNGSITTDVLKGAGDAVGPGFGVFGYYTDNNEYDQRSTPNFMYNQQVTAKFASDAHAAAFQSWEYKPIVYWPNEYGSNANSDDQDKVTFFAYAPYIKVIPTSGKLADTSNDAEEWGITGMTRNSNQGDPILKYIAQFRADRSVDLCWGVADNEDGYKWMTTQDGVAQQKIENGTPWLNLFRPADAEGQKVKFTFKHALAQMRINIDAEIDEIRGTNDYYTPNKTRVWVREVTFKGFALKGALNLDNSEANTAKWLDYNGQNELVAEDVTVYDGRKDGKEGVNGAVATNEKLTGLNPAIVQDGIYEGVSSSSDPYAKGDAIVVKGVKPASSTVSDENYKRTGVPGTPVALFAQDATNQNITASGSDKLFHVIPTDDNFEIEIVYDIETVSKNLAQNLSDGATKGSSIENRIRKTINFGDATKLEAGKSYTVNLHLGLNSVKFDAEVGEWINEIPQDVDLPLNAPIYAASTTTSGPGSSAAPYEVTLPYTGDYTFAIKGLNGGESVTYAPSTTTFIGGWNCTTENAWSNGYALETLTTNVNPTTLKRIHEASWKGDLSDYQTYFKFTQAAHPLFLTGTGAVDGTTITLTRHNNANPTSESTDWTTNGTETGWWTDATGVADSKYIKVWRNGVELSHITSGPVGNSQFLFTDTGDSNKKDATITIKDNLKNGDIIKVTLKTGDAPEETISFKVTTP